MVNKILYVALFTLTSLIAKANHKLEIKQTDTTEIVDKNIQYKVFNDGYALHVNISTSDKKTSIAMIKNGLTVYFDTKGKKKEKVYIKYPVKNNSKIRQQRSETKQTNKVDLKTIIENIPTEAEYEYYGEKRVFDKDLNMLNISLGYKTNGDLLTYYLKIPKDKITKKNKTDLSKLTIGVITNKHERSSNETMDENNNMSRGGGMRSGGGRSGGGRRGGNRGQNNNQEVAEKIEFNYWFDANLKDE